MTVGERIKAARESAQMTQEQLGALCGTTKQTIFKYESNIITNIPIDRLERIADVLDVPPANLMGWSNGSAPVSPSALDADLIQRLTSLTPEEQQKVDAFVQGLLASR